MKHPALITAGIWLAVMIAVCLISSGRLPRPTPLLTLAAVSWLTILIWQEVNNWSG